jgi:MFS family permease
VTQIDDRGGRGRTEDAGTTATASRDGVPSEVGGVATGSAKPSWRGATFAALEVPTYRLLWYGGVFSFLAVQMQMVARAALAYDLTGSNGSLGIVMFWFGLPMLLCTPIGGVAADRFSKRRVILTAQWMLILSSAFLAVVLLLDAIEFWMLPASSAVQAASFAFLGPSRMAFTTELVGRRLLSNAVVLQQLSMNGTRVFGPAIAGVLTSFVWFGYEGAYITTGLLTVAATVMTMRLPPGRPPADKVVKNPIREFADGLGYVASNPHVALLLIVSLVVVMSAFPYVAFLASLSKDVFGFGADNTGYGIMSGATAVGAVSASLFIASRSNGPNVWKLQAFAGAMFGAGLIMLAIAPTFWTSILVLVVIGGATSSFQALNNTMVLMASETAFHGRVQALMGMSFAGFGLVAYPLGVLADAVGLRATFAMMGAITVAAMGVYFVVRPILDRRHPLVLHDD